MDLLWILDPGRVYAVAGGGGVFSSVYDIVPIVQRLLKEKKLCVVLGLLVIHFFSPEGLLVYLNNFQVQILIV